MADKKDGPKTKNYVLKTGKHSGRDEDGNIVDYLPGDEVPLTDTAYEAFKDKFEAPKSNTRKSDKEGLAPGETKTTPTEPKAEESKPSDGKTGAGAAANSTNTAKI